MSNLNVGEPRHYVKLEWLGPSGRHPGEVVGFEDHVAGTFPRANKSESPAAKQAFVADCVGFAGRSFDALRLERTRRVT
jgi:hypothetical protein